MQQGKLASAFLELAAPKKGTPISLRYLDQHFAPQHLPLSDHRYPHYRIEICTYVKRTLTISQWGEPSMPGEKTQWQVWIEGFDICRITYVEQLLSLMKGLNATLPDGDKELIISKNMKK